MTNKENNTKCPKECISKEEIRNEIDKIDKEIICLFAKRFEYVKEIVKFKEENKDSIIAQDRKDQVIKNRGEWAHNLGLDSATFEKIYHLLIDHNIEKELEILDNKRD